MIPIFSRFFPVQHKNPVQSKRILAATMGLMLFYHVLLLADDWRNIRNGFEIPSKTYADQPYIVKTDDGAWLCIITTGAGLEGEVGQHVITMRSTDQGKSWSKPVALEPADGPEASYAVLLKAPYGRIYAFYNHNSDNVRRIKADNPPYKNGWCYRVDSQGYYADGRLIKHPRAANFVFKCNNGKYRQFGWGRLNPNMRHANGSQLLKIDKSVTSLKIFNRYLRTSEAIALYKDFKSSQSVQP
jgi:hypothetical protein